MTLIGGIVFLFPIAIFLAVIGQGLKITAAMVGPVARPAGRHAGGIAVAHVLAILLLILIGFLAGLLAAPRWPAGRSTRPDLVLVLRCRSRSRLSALGSRHERSHPAANSGVLKIAGAPSECRADIETCGN